MGNIKFFLLDQDPKAPWKTLFFFFFFPVGGFQTRLEVKTKNG